MKVLCAWCEKDLGDKPPYSCIEVSHGICKPCSLKVEKDRKIRKAQRIGSEITKTKILLHGLVKDNELYCPLVGQNSNLDRCFYLHSNSCPKFDQCQKWEKLLAFIQDNNISHLVNPEVLERKFVPIATD